MRFPRRRPRLLAGRYELHEELGAGGMGTVFRATDRRTRITVAVKILHPFLRHDRSYVERFRREAQLAATLDSPHLVQVSNFGSDGDTYFLAMEFVAGQSLADVLKKGPVEERTALRIAAQVARALEEAHGKGIIHRDVKPQNILIQPDGNAKLADLGIARVETMDTLTVGGGLLGSVHYIAPEVFRGQLDERSDIYSLGAVTYQMLTGQVPFSGDTPFEVIHKHLELPFPTPRGMRPDITDLLQACLEKNPHRRIGTARDLRDRLDAQVLEISEFEGNGLTLKDEDSRRERRRLPLLRRKRATDDINNREALALRRVANEVRRTRRAWMMPAAIGLLVALMFVITLPNFGASSTRLVSAEWLADSSNKLCDLSVRLDALPVGSSVCLSLVLHLDEGRHELAFDYQAPTFSYREGRVIHAPRAGNMRTTISGIIIRSEPGQLRGQVIVDGERVAELQATLVPFVPLALDSAEPDCSPIGDETHCEYLVQAGDTLSSIASKFDIVTTEVADWERIAQSNPGVNPDDPLLIGQSLLVPRPGFFLARLHIVNSGDTIVSICQETKPKHLSTSDCINTLLVDNGLKPDETLVAGERIRLTFPTAGSAAAHPKLHTAETIWQRSSHQEADYDDCFEGSREVAACLRAAMTTAGASPPALQFFDDYGGWLLGLVEGVSVDVGRFEPWTGRDIGPILVLINSPERETFEISGVIRRALNVTPDHLERAFALDPFHGLVRDVLERTGASARDEPQLTYWGITYLESITLEASWSGCDGAGFGA